MIDVETMVKSRIAQLGGDGLMWDDCGCVFDDFVPCAELCRDCVAAKRVDCTDDCNHEDGGADYHMVALTADEVRGR